MDEGHTSIMSGFYGHQYHGNGVERGQEQHNRNVLMGLMGPDGGMDPNMVGGQTLDEIISQNNKELQRRRSHQQLYDAGRPTEEDLRRTSMMEFGPGGNSELDGYQFDLSPLQNSAARIGRGNGIAARRGESHRVVERRPSRGSIGLNTQFHELAPTFNAMPQATTYQPQLNPSDTLDMDVTGPFLPAGLPMGMDFSATGLEQDAGGNMTPMNMFTQSDFQPALTTSPLHQAFSSSFRGPAQDPGGGNVGRGDEQDLMEKMPNMQMSDRMQGMQPTLGQPKILLPGDTSTGQVQGLPGLNALNEAQPDTAVISTANSKVMGFTTGEPTPNAVGPELPKFTNVYSSSGFDMLGVLMRVAARPNPQINIGAVDMSCAFVVCDVTQHDIPIVYCSDIFERLTGYTRFEILGRNCRFLQAPDGKVQSGVKRKYVDDDIIFHLKHMVTKRSEVQTSLINYRKGGQPFMNLLTMIPITWDSDEIKYYVGFQVDLVETPNSVTNKNPDGSYAINYQRGLLPRYIVRTPETSAQHPELGQTIPRDEVSTVLSTIGTAEESELSKRILDKVLLENTDDVVHVLSLKGLFLYLSPSSRKVLEYEPVELIGTALSSVCHPSDIVPVTRELKDTSTGASVNVVFRIRRKHSGYTWFESHGSLHTEQGKGRKCIILVGRERPVYALARGDIVAAGGIGESELWTKMSTSGMFLFVSSMVRTLLDRQPEDLVGTSIQSLMRPESKLEFGRILELARTGKRACFKHDMQNKRGQVLQAQTTIYPGDAVEGAKPTFLVAQTRLLKSSRSQSGTKQQGASLSPRTDQASAGSGTPSTNLSTGSSGAQTAGPSVVTPQSAATSIVYPEAVVTTAGGNGLPIGTQDLALASEENVFDELKTTRSTSWQFELRQMEKRNRLLAEELQSLLSAKKKRKRRKGAGQSQKDCANCHTRVTPEWRRGPSGNRDLCNSCGLRWAKQNGRVSPRTSSQHSDKQSDSPAQSSPVAGEYVSNGFNRPGSTSLQMPEKRSPQSVNAESHNAKTARMEATALQGYGGGIPAKIEEGVEPPERVKPII